MPSPLGRPHIACIVRFFRIECLVFKDSSDLGLEGLVAQAPDVGAGYGGRESGARGDLDFGVSEHLADLSGSELLLLGFDSLAGQRAGARALLR